MHVFRKFTKEIHLLASSVGVTHRHVLFKMFLRTGVTLTIFNVLHGGESLILTVRFLHRVNYPWLII